MKWGVRRYQNEDGTLTEAGKKRYTKGTYQKSMSDSVREQYANSKVEKYGGIKAIEREQKAYNRSKNLRTATTSAIALGTATAALSMNMPLAGAGLAISLGKTYVDMYKNHTQKKNMNRNKEAIRLAAAKKQ